MYAVIQTGGKQYRVAVGDRLKVESLTAKQGDSINIEKVLMISDQGSIRVGTPLLTGESVTARVVDAGRNNKIKVFKMQRRQGYRRTQGHRQNYTEIEITEIAGQTGVNTADDAPADTASAVEPVDIEMNDPGSDDTVTAATAKGKTTGSPDDPQVVVDDLTQINGIGPVISKKLNDMGYTRFAQIASLDESEVAKIEEQLSFKGRVEREDWINQAIELSK